MVDLHDLFSSLLFTGIMGFILNFGVEMVIEVLLGMKYIVHIKRRRNPIYMQDCHSSSHLTNMHSKFAFFQNLCLSRLK